MSKKTEITAKLLAAIPEQYPLPDPLSDATLVEQGLHAILRRKLPADAAKETLQRLRDNHKDWNELRVTQAQEISQGLALGAKGVPVARDVRDYLQEVFQRSHGMDLEFLRDDPQATQRFVSILPFIGMGTAHYLLYLANGKELPVTPPLMRVLDRIGLVPRTASTKKARVSIEPIVPAGATLEFAVKFGEIATRWCDARKPTCHLCVLVDECKFGRKAFRDWKVQQERLEQQRAREAVRMALLQKKEEARRAREAERQRKKEALEAAKRAKEIERRAKLEAKRRQAEEERVAKLKAADAARKAKESARVRARQEAEAKKKAAEKRRAAEHKAAEARRAAAAKKAAAKQAAAKKSAAASRPKKRR